MEIIKILEKQYKLHRATEENQTKLSFDWIPGKFTTISEEPCGWSVVKFSAEDGREIPVGIWNEQEQFITDTGQMLTQISSRKFRVKNFVPSMQLKPIIQDDYTSARYKSSIMEFPDDVQRFWQNEALITSVTNNKELNINDNMKVPLFRIKSINIIRGVPGSGKSTFCRELCKKHQNEKILYTAPNHQQVSNFSRKLIEQTIGFTVLSEESRLEKDLRKYHNANQPDFNEKIKNQILPSAKVTLSTSTKPIKNLRSAGITILIVDEATRVSLIDAITLVRKMPELKVIILCGDSKQLGARIGNHKVLDIFRYAMNQNVTRFFLPYQYRFGQGTNDIISSIFYKGKMRYKLQNRKSEIHFVIIKDCLCDSLIGCDREVEAVRKLIEIIPDVKDIGIITPYLDQVSKLESIQEFRDSITSIDTCQGAEYQNSLVSIARHKGLGFIDKARLNVALTRARENTVVIVNKNVLATSKDLAKLYENAVKRNLVIELDHGPSKFCKGPNDNKEMV